MFAVHDTRSYLALFIIESYYYETLLDEVGWNVFDSTGLYLGIEFTLSRGWLEILFHIAINILLFILN